MTWSLRQNSIVCGKIDLYNPALMERSESRQRAWFLFFHTIQPIRSSLVRSLVIVLFLTLFSSIACADVSTELDKYYPLETGNNWIYSSPLVGLQQHSVKPYKDDPKGYAIEVKSRGGGKYLTILQKNGDRLEKTGSIGRDGIFKQILPPQAILVAPLKKGSTWEYKDGDQFTQQFTIIGFISMTTTAGKFTKVLKIEKNTLNVKNRSTEGAKSFLYFAPNIGLIKEESVGKNRRAAVVMELVSYHLAGKRKK